MAAPSRQSLVAYARRVAVQNGVDPDIFVRQIQQESGFDPNAHNASGASGIGQLMPQFYPNVDASDPYASLDAAAQTMGENVKRYGGDYAKALAAYNAGGGAVAKYGGVPPFAETQRYVKTIMGGQQDASGQPTAGVDPDLEAIYREAEGGAATPGQAGNATGTYGPPAPAGTGQGGPPQAGIDGNAILRMLEAKKGGGESMAVISNETIKTTGDQFGSGTAPNPEITRRYSWPDGSYVDIVAPRTGNNPAYVKGGTALKVLSGGTTAETKTFPDGSLRQYNATDDTWKVIGEPPANKADPAPKTTKTPQGTYQYDNGAWTLIPGTAPAGANLTIHTMPDGSLQSYDPDTQAWQMIQPRYVDPQEAAYKRALTGEATARTGSIIQGMRSKAQAAVEDAHATIASIEQQLASGAITPKDAANLVNQVHQGVAAAIAGTTIFEQKKQAEDTQTQRANAASQFLQQRIQSGASLGASLFNSATGHVLMPAGQSSLGIDPMAIANEEVNAMGGGAATGDAAGAFLRAALQGQQQGGGDQGGGPPLTGQDGQPLHGVFPTSAIQQIGAQPQGDTMGPLQAPGSAQGNFDAMQPTPFAQSGLSEGRSFTRPTTQMAQRMPIPPPLGRG